MKFADYTFVISCRRHQARRRRFTEQAVAAGLEQWGFFDAYDGEAMQLATGTPGAHGRAGRPAPLPLGPGELGCLLSHMAVWRAALALGMGTVAVLEDDVEIIEPARWPGPRWDAFVAELPEDWLMVHVGEPVCRSDSVVARAEPVQVSPQVSRVGQQYGTWCMVMRPKALEMLSKAADRAAMSEPADWLLLGLFATGRVYRPTFGLFQVRDEAGIQQTVT